MSELTRKAILVVWWLSQEPVQKPVPVPRSRSTQRKPASIGAMPELAKRIIHDHRRGAMSRAAYDFLTTGVLK